MWLSSVKNVITNCYRCRKSRSASKCLPNIEIKAKEKLKNYKSITGSQRWRLIQESLKERSVDRNALDVTDFLAAWPFLNHQDGLRMEFKAVSKKSSIEYIIARLRRAFPGIYSYCIKLKVIFLKDLQNCSDLEKIPAKYGDEGKILYIVINHKITYFKNIP